MSYIKGKNRGQIFKEVKVTSGVPRGRVLGPLLFLVYVNDTWRIIDSSIRHFADDCAIYREITNKKTAKICRRILTPWGNGR